MDSGKLIDASAFVNKKVFNDPIKNKLFLRKMIDRGMEINVDIDQLTYKDRVELCHFISDTVKARDEQDD